MKGMRDSVGRLVNSGRPIPVEDHRQVFLLLSFVLRSRSLTATNMVASRTLVVRNVDEIHVERVLSHTKRDEGAS
jgi:hypothetical protein